jgi:hypothetical protein
MQIKFQDGELTSHTPRPDTLAAAFSKVQTGQTILIFASGRINLSAVCEATEAAAAASAVAVAQTASPATSSRNKQPNTHARVAVEKKSFSPGKRTLEGSSTTDANSGG